MDTNEFTLFAFIRSLPRHSALATAGSIRGYSFRFVGILPLSSSPMQRLAGGHSRAAPGWVKAADHADHNSDRNRYTQQSPPDVWLQKAANGRGCSQGFNTHGAEENADYAP